MARQHSFTNTLPHAHRTLKKGLDKGPHIRSAVPRILASAFAEQQGVSFAGAKAKARQAALGQFFTPKAVADFMGNMFSDRPRGPKLRILDPGAGTGILSCALIERVAQWANKPEAIELVAYEIDEDLLPVLKKSLQLLGSWLRAFDISLTASINHADFVLPYVDAERGSKAAQAFDLIVSNPPYYKLPQFSSAAKGDRQAAFQNLPNMYTLFMAIAASVLKPDGQLTFITPRSFASGPYFSGFRKQFFEQITPAALHVFQSRDKAFKKDSVLQETVIFHGTRVTPSETGDRPVRISSSDGLSDLARANVIHVPLSEVISSDRDRILHIPTDPSHREIIKTVGAWKQNLRSLGMEVSTGPIVAFRSREILDADTTNTPCAPLLWLHNIKTMRVHWPLKIKKQQYVPISQKSRRLLVPKNNYVLVRRFSTKEEKRRLVAAPLIAAAVPAPYIGIENHLNYIYRKARFRKSNRSE